MSEFRDVEARIRIPKEWVHIATRDTSPPFILGNSQKLDLDDALCVDLVIDGLFDMEETQPAGDDTSDIAVLRGNLVPSVTRLEVIG